MPEDMGLSEFVKRFGLKYETGLFAWACPRCNAMRVHRRGKRCPICKLRIYKPGEYMFLREGEKFGMMLSKRVILCIWRNHKIYVDSSVVAEYTEEEKLVKEIMKLEKL